MTENEAIKAIENDLEWHSKELQPKYKKVLRYVITALEEIQQYRAIGSVEEVKAIVNIGKWGYKKGYNKAIEEFTEELKKRLTDAIHQKDVESMTNLINDVAREVKAGGKNE